MMFNLHNATYVLNPHQYADNAIDAVIFFVLTALTTQKVSRFVTNALLSMKRAKRNGRRIMDNPYWEDVKHLFKGDEIETAFDQAGARDKYCRLYSWAIADPASLEFVAEHLGPRAIEIGAGNGYWAWQLSQLDVDIVAYDYEPPDKVPNRYFCPVDEKRKHIEITTPTWYPVAQGDSAILKEYPERTLLLCWPPYGGSVGTECLKAYRGNRFVFIGEGEGGCTGDDEFFELLEKEWNEVEAYPIKQWYGINDCITVYSRK